MLSASWQTLGRYHGLVPINSRLGPEHMHALHQPRIIRPLLKRGQARGAFNPDLPLDWMLTVLLDLIHAAAASLAVTTGRLPADTAELALIATIRGAFAPTSEVMVALT
jgi:hypothetical protein